MPEGYNGDPGLPPTPTGPRNLPEEEAAALAAHRLAVRERELSAVAPCACGAILDEQVLFDFYKVLENAGLGPIQSTDIVNQMQNAGLLIRRRAR